MMGHLLHRAARAADAHIAAVLQPLDLSARAATVLCELARHEGGLPQSELARALGIDPGTLREIVGRLRGRDLIEVTLASDDARMKPLRLTDEGRAVAERADELLVKGDRQVAGGTAHPRDLRRLLLQLVENLEAEGEKGNADQGH